MGSLKRSIARKRRLKQTKIAKTNLRERLRVNKDMPTSCTDCARMFDRDTSGALDNWHIRFDNDTSTLALYCQECWKLSDSA